MVTTATNSVTLAIGTNPGGDAWPAPPTRSTHRRRGHLRRLQDHRQAGQLHPDRGSPTGFTTVTEQRLHHHRRRRQPSSPSPPSPGRGQRHGLDHPARRDHPGRRRQHRDHGQQLDHLGHRHQPRRGAGLHHQPGHATGGVASFGGCKITGKAGSYTLTAAATGLARRQRAPASTSRPARPPSWSSRPSPAAEPTGRPGRPSRS